MALLVVALQLLASVCLAVASWLVAGTAGALAVVALGLLVWSEAIRRAR